MKIKMKKWYKPTSRRSYLKDDLGNIKVKKRDLLDLYSRYLSENKFREGKAQLVNLLTHFYEKGELLLERRVEEEEVMQNVDTENMHFVLTPKGGSKSFTLPKDLMEHILSFLKRDRKLLNHIALVDANW